jgi:uncharacterized protein YeeX (DUF496 family)
MPPALMTSHNAKGRVDRKLVDEHLTRDVHEMENKIADIRKQILVRDAYKAYITDKTQEKTQEFRDEMKERLDELFQNADALKTGSLTKEVFKSELKLEKLKLLLRQTGQMKRFNLDGFNFVSSDEIFNALDLDENGVITYEEFMASLHLHDQLGFAAASGPLTLASRQLMEVCKNGGVEMVRCAVFDRGLHSRVVRLRFTPLLRFKRAGVWPMAFFSGVHFSYRFTL